MEYKHTVPVFDGLYIFKDEDGKRFITIKDRRAFSDWHYTGPISVRNFVGLWLGPLKIEEVEHAMVV